MGRDSARLSATLFSGTIGVGTCSRARRVGETDRPQRHELVWWGTGPWGAAGVGAEGPCSCLPCSGGPIGGNPQTVCGKAPKMSAAGEEGRGPGFSVLWLLGALESLCLINEEPKVKPEGQLGVVAHTCGPSTGAGGLQVGAQPVSLSKTPFQNKSAKRAGDGARCRGPGSVPGTEDKEAGGAGSGL